MGFVPFMVSQAVCVWLELDMPLRRGRHCEGAPLKKKHITTAGLAGGSFLLRKIRKSDVTVRMEQKEYSEDDTVNDKRQKGIVFQPFHHNENGRD